MTERATVDHGAVAERDMRILTERARLLARLPVGQADAGETMELAAFRLGAERFGVPTAMVCEVQPLSVLKWTRVPGAPDFIAGIVNLRGRIYSIMDLARFWGLPARALSGQAHILLVRGGVCEDGLEMALTLLSDDLPAIVKIPANRLMPPPAMASQQAQAFVMGVTDDMLVALDLRRLLSDPSLIVSETT